MVALALSGCSDLEGSDDAGYVTGQGVVTVQEPGERDAAVDRSFETIDGETLDLADYRGKPVVLVVWGSWCVPCRAEQPEVNEAAEQLGDSAAFVGINLREPSVANAQAYVRDKQVPYPSIDANDGRALLAFQGTLTPYTIPAFVVLDGEGRVAASIIGSLPSTLTLVDLVEEVADGG
ncbi:TlpA disulfide reductase family protein [Nocardioides nanhaiensis]|uniref:Thioredoxin domain-containing protein n=1 Tax=Nocardioides nanhaiensis TaxID=1476871 RepID=A0ABP8WBE7_9ACTN